MKERIELKKVALIAALDTRGGQAKLLQQRVQEKGCEVLIIDIGVLGRPEVPADVSRERVAKAGGTSLEKLIRAAEDGIHQARAVQVMARGVSRLARELYDAGNIDGIMAVGGTTATSVALAAMKGLPVGVSKLMVTTAIGGQSVDDKDIMMMPLTDDVGACLDRAAYAMAGTVKAEAQLSEESLPTIGITALGVTTPGVEHTVRLLKEKGYDPVVFHARSKILEELIQEDRIQGIIDFTSFETYLLGRERLLSAGRKALPQVIVPGGLDMLIFPGTRDMLSKEYSRRPVHEHGPMVVLVRTNQDEVSKATGDIANRANAALGPVKIVIPTRGFSSVDKEGHPFYAPQTDQVFTEILKERLTPEVQFLEIEHHINDRQFAEKVVDIFHRTFS